MTFPTSGLVDNQVHTENNRSFVYDSTLLVWDQAPEAPETISILGGGKGLDDVTLGSSVVFPGEHIIQVVYFETGEVQTGTEPIGHDDTIPLITEGDEYMTLAITPTSATNKLMVEVIHNMIGGSIATEHSMIGSIFNTDFHSTNALATTWTGHMNTYGMQNCTIRCYVVAGTTNATTFRFRGGSGSVGTTTFNGRASGRLFKGALKSSIRILEIQV